MPIPLIKPTGQPGQPGMAPSVYTQPGPRSSTQQLQTQMGNAPITMGSGKQTGAPAGAPARRLQPFTGSTKPFTPTSTFRGVSPMAKPVFPATPTPPKIGAESTPTELIAAGITPATAGSRSGEVIAALQQRDIPGYFPGAVYSGLRGWYDPNAPGYETV